MLDSEVIQPLLVEVSMKVQILQTSVLQSNLVLKELLILILEILVLVQNV